MSYPFRAPDPAARPNWAPVLEILGAGLAAADARGALHRSLRREGDRLRFGPGTIDLGAVDKVYLLAAGKAAAAMALAAEGILSDRLEIGVGVTVPGATAGLTRTTLHSGGHPLPNAGSLAAARHMARLLEQVTERDLVLVLLSGGASALLEFPAGRITLADLQAATASLLASGATIDEMNAVRKHLSRVKGGGLARLAAPARVLALVLSDVVGDPLDVIASGPTVGDPTTFADAGAVLTRYGLWSQIPAPVADHLRAGLAGQLPETAKPSDPLFERVTTAVIGGNRDAAEAAMAQAETLGYQGLCLTTWLQGEAREAGNFLAAVAKEVVTHDRPVQAPACLVAGGETTVTLRRLGGSGGRNQELALSAALALAGWPRVTLAAMGTDGIDGSTPHAGAVVDGATVARGQVAGKSAREALDRHDSGTFFAGLGDAIVTGPTGTNVNDLVIVLIEADPGPASD